MSTLKVGTIQNTSGGSSSTPEQIEQGRAKAWVNFAASDGSIRDNFNVSSVDDHGTGDYTVNFSSALADNDYAWFVSAGRGSNEGAIVAAQDTTDMTSSAFRFTTRNLVNNKENFTHVCAGFFR